MPKKRRTLLEPVWLLPVLLLCLSALALAWLWQSDRLDRFESGYADAWHQLAGVRYTPRDVSMVLIDEKSLSAFKDTPLSFWSPQFAQVLDILHREGADWVGVDMLFTISAEKWLRQFKPDATKANYDQPLRLELSKGRTLLASSYLMGEGDGDLMLPTSDLVLALPNQDMEKHLGLVNLLPDGDGVIRHFECEPAMRLGTEWTELSNRPRWGFAALLVRNSLRLSPEEADRRMAQQACAEPRRISYAGPVGTVESVSFSDLLEAGRRGKLPREMHDKIAGRLIIIGSDYPALNDFHPTPHGTGLLKPPSLMSGVEIQANIVQTMMAAPRLQETVEMMFLLPLLMLGLASVGFRYVSVPMGSALLLGLGVLSAGVGYMGFLNDRLFPSAALQVLLLFAAGLTYGARFIGEIRIRRHVQLAFGRYVSKEVVEHLVQSGEMPKLGGESVEVSVLFSDIRNFTSISERLTPEEVVTMINTYFSSAVEQILQRQGNIDKFIGDAIMAEFGAPVHLEDHALQAISAGVALRDTAHAYEKWFHKRFPQLQDLRFRIGVGIHSGEVTMGNIGSPSRTEYTALGDTVNVASRLESMTKETGWEVMASEAAVRAAGPSVIVGESRLLQLKGRAQAITVYEILGVRDQQTSQEIELQKADQQT